MIKKFPDTLLEIAKYQGISLSYLEQLFALLRKHNLVSGIRGPGGGNKLSDEPENITIAQIINAINSDVEQKEASERKDEVIWSTFSAKLCNYLETVTLGSLITENSSVNMSESAQTESMIDDVIEEVMVNRI